MNSKMLITKDELSLTVGFNNFVKLEQAIQDNISSLLVLENELGQLFLIWLSEIKWYDHNEFIIKKYHVSCIVRWKSSTILNDRLLQIKPILQNTLWFRIYSILILYLRDFQNYKILRVINFIFYLIEFYRFLIYIFF